MAYIAKLTNTGGVKSLNRYVSMKAGNIFASVSGGTLSSDATYYYRAFTANGNLVVSDLAITADILVIAGGGSGGGGTYDYWGQGGGGAGGVVALTSQTLSPGTFAAVIGAGGAGSNTSSNSGTNSQLGALTAAVGGGRGAAEAIGPAIGGSGGGGSAITTPTGAAGTSGQGFAGKN